VQQYIGESKLGSRNAIQFLDTLFSLYDELNGFKEQWNKMIRAVWRKVYGTEAGEMTINLPDDLFSAMKQPLITRWWTIGCLAILASKYLPSFYKMAKGVKNMTDTSDKENTVASNLLSLASSKWIINDVHFLSAITNSFLNPHMHWYQGADPNISTPGFFAFHRQVQYFLQIEDLEDMKQNWKTKKEFKVLVDYTTEMEKKELKEQIVGWFIGVMTKQGRCWAEPGYMKYMRIQTFHDNENSKRE
jgi:hypothetical protein